MGAGTTLAAALLLTLARSGAGDAPPPPAAAQPVVSLGGNVADDASSGSSPRLLLVGMDRFQPGPLAPAAAGPPAPPIAPAPPPPAPAPAAKPPKPPKGHRQSGGATWFPAPAGTCAHVSLPKGTIVTVTVVTTGASTTCRVNDRGPFGPGMVIDLSKDTFAKLAEPMTGVLPVELRW